MRRKNSIRNGIMSIISNFITILIGIVSQAIFIKTLSSEYLGLNSLFSNIISMLSIVEMGIGSAIIYNLYAPIANKDYDKINSLMIFYKKSYRIIGGIVLFLGLIIIPFIPHFVTTNLNVNIYIIYLLFLLDSVLSYFLSYKRSIIYANQKNYIINLVHIFYCIILNTLQIIILLVTKNYYLYLIVKILMRVVENIIITIIANKMYEYLKNNNIKKLDKSTEKDIFKKIKALFFHKIGTFIVLGTDNIIISKFLGLTTVGLYSNYYLIINSSQIVLNQIILSTTAPVGNMLVTEKVDKQFNIFNKIRFLNFWLSCVFSICIFIIMDSFIKLWIGEKYILDISILLVLVINFYFNSTRSTYQTFKDAAGIFYEDRFVPLFESFLNIFFSTLLVKKFGLVGVFLGTIISGLSLWLYSYPKYIYNKLFNKSYKKYFIETLKYFIIFIIILGISYFISNICVFNNDFINFIKNCLIALIIPNIFLALLYTKNDNYIYYKNIIINKIKGDKNE